MLNEMNFRLGRLCLRGYETEENGRVRKERKRKEY